MARKRKIGQLPPEHVRFISEYLIDDNATRAYKAAYPEAAYTTCRTNGGLLLAKSHIQAEIRAARLARQKRTLIKADNALKEAGRLAFADPLYLFEEDGITPRNMRDIPMDTRRAIAGVKVRRERVERRGEETITYEIVEFKMVPKQVGLDKVFKHLGLTTEITPLDALLAALPEELAGQVRQALAGLLPTNKTSEGSSSDW